MCSWVACAEQVCRAQCEALLTRHCLVVAQSCPGVPQKGRGEAELRTVWRSGVLTAAEGCQLGEGGCCSAQGVYEHQG